MTFFEQSVFFGVSESLVSYGLGVLLQKKCRLALCNPLLISVAVTIALLVTAHIDYDVYYEGAKYLSYLLTPATVCLAVPLYEKLALLRVVVAHDDRVVDAETELQHRCDGVGDERDLMEPVVRALVDPDGHAKGDDEHRDLRVSMAREQEHMRMMSTMRISCSRISPVGLPISVVI